MNTGIGGTGMVGRTIAAKLAGQGIHVILTSRDEAKGKAAQQKLAAAGLDAAFHQLDVTDAGKFLRDRREIPW